MANIVNIINSFLADFKKQNHVTSPYASFTSKYYVVKKDGSAIVTASPYALENVDWGIIEIFYGMPNYRGYIETESTKFMFKDDGTIDRTLKYGDVTVYSNMTLMKGSKINIFSHGEDEVERLQFVAKILPWISSCTTQEEADELVKKIASGETKPAENMNVSELLQKNKELEQKVQTLEKKLAAIMSALKD